MNDVTIGEVAQEWLPLESAPRRTRVPVFDSHEGMVGAYDDGQRFILR